MRSVSHGGARRRSGDAAWLSLVCAVGLTACASNQQRAVSVAGPSRALSSQPEQSAAKTQSVTATRSQSPLDAALPRGKAERSSRSVQIQPHPLAKLSDAELEQLLLNEPDKLGAMSVGRPGAGALFGGVPMPEHPHWNIVNPRETFGTPETIAYLSHTIHRVNEEFPDTPPLNVGDISIQEGGHLAPHITHQNGRDVDLGYYYTNDDARWYARATARNLDLARTWAFVRIAVTETDVQVILMDRRIQKLVREYATSLGEDEAWLDEIFGGPMSERRPLVVHEPGHDTHLHVRYYNPIAQQTGRRLHQALIAHGMMKPPTYFVKYKVKRGDSLHKLARKFNTSVEALKRANGLRSSRIIANRTYKIPRRGGVARIDGELEIPDRRLPPTATSRAAVVPSSAERD